jgi:hypothetical protein
MRGHLIPILKQVSKRRLSSTSDCCLFAPVALFLFIIWASAVLEPVLAGILFDMGYGGAGDWSAEDNERIKLLI